MVANTTEFAKQRQEIRAANTLAMIVGTFIVAWSPTVIICFVISITENRSVHHGFLMVGGMMVHMNSAIDPLIYAYRMNNVRKALKNFFKCGKTTDSAQNSSSSGARFDSNKTSFKSIRSQIS